MKPNMTLPTIPEEEITPTVLKLLAYIEQQAYIIQQLMEDNQRLKDEIARLKKQPPRPKIRPSQLENKGSGKKKRKGKKRPGSEKRAKTAELIIHETKPIEPENLPAGSEFKYHKPFVVQDIRIEPHNTRYLLRVYQTPDGRLVAGKLPEQFNQKHFGPTLICFILYQYYNCHVTQPLLLEQLLELGVDISAGQLNNILIEDKERYHQEKDQILATALQVASFVNVDDTGARHKGNNGYCTHIGNELFSWFESTGSKSRINFLKLMRAGHSDYAINMDAIAYMQENRLRQAALQPIIDNLGALFVNDEQWAGFLSKHGIVKDRHVQIATEGVLIGSIIEHGISKDLVVVSDDAGQFNVLLHALCWIHANRAIDKIVPFTDQAKKDLNTVKDQVWRLYDGLKKYKQKPTGAAKKKLDHLFDDIFSQTTASETLNVALKRIYNNKSELLMVLERPDIPLHNNSAENAIREYVKKRKISGSTRSENGRRCRDTFTSLKKTCRKLGLSFWQYLKDRVRKIGHIPDMSDLIRQRALNPG